MPGPFKLRVHRAQGWLSPVLLVNGRMDGVWKYEKKGNRVLVTIEPFATVSRQVKVGAEAEAERIAAFLGGKLDLVWA
ncbi:MAG: crosslink repair DNA glycosylase YcaQ family protein [Actinomycetota bacterium]